MSVVSAVLTLINDFFLTALSYVEHRRTVRPSLILNIFLLFTLLFDAARVRTLWLMRDRSTIAIIFTTAVTSKLTILCLEAIQKKRSLRPQYRSYPPEAVSGIINRCLFWWLNLLLLRGYSKNFQLDDLFALDKHLLASYLEYILGSAWKKGTRSSHCTPHL